MVWAVQDTRLHIAPGDKHGKAKQYLPAKLLINLTHPSCKTVVEALKCTSKCGHYTRAVHDCRLDGSVCEHWKANQYLPAKLLTINSF